MEIKGRYAEAKIFTDEIEEAALSQIFTLLDQPFAKDADPRFMPDVHAGKGCTIGTTMKITDQVCPNLVGVDIACGMLVVRLDTKDIDLKKLDEAVHAAVPAGRNVHAAPAAVFDEITQLRCWKALKANEMYYRCSVGTLGGGNHFVEADRAEDGTLYLVIHSGSRNLGKAVCEHYMEKAEEMAESGRIREQTERTEMIGRMKKEGRQKEIPEALKELSKKFRTERAAFNKDLAVISGDALEDYLHDCAIINRYACLNRETMASRILAAFGMKLADLEYFHTIHNYIDTEHRILRKGAISAAKGEKLIIPLNMRDGCILGIGKGNPDWNFSGPHGAGRKMSRAQAKKDLTVEEFKETMSGIYSTTVNASTLDEAPGAYKDSESIIVNVEESVEILEIIKPVYNFKASE